MACACPAMELTVPSWTTHLSPTVHQVNHGRLVAGQNFGSAPLHDWKHIQKKKGRIKAAYEIKTGVEKDEFHSDRDQAFRELLSPFDILQQTQFDGSADRDADFLNGDWIVRSFSASVQSTPPPKQKEDKSDRGDYYINTGYAIRALREELPLVFYKEPTFDIYREDIVFKDPLNTFSGIENYKLIFWALRFHGRIFFKALWVDILRVWHPSENVIMIRWTVHGIPRVPWETQGRFDGTSEYKLDKDGKIYEHKVDNVALTSPPKFNVPVVENLIRALGCPSTPKPTYFESVGFLFLMFLPYLIQFTWVRYYLAMKGTIDLKNVTLRFSCLQA
eukprot:Gb_32567 [translate_table: standard]